MREANKQNVLPRLLQDWLYAAAVTQETAFALECRRQSQGRSAVPMMRDSLVGLSMLGRLYGACDRVFLSHECTDGL